MLEEAICDKCLGTGHKLDPVEMGKAFRERRLKKGFSGVAVAKAMDIDTATLSVLETGKRSWTSYYAIRFEQALNILEEKKKAA